MTEHEAFIETVTYCQPWTAGENVVCSNCGDLPAGQAFEEHLWDVFTIRRSSPGS